MFVLFCFGQELQDAPASGFISHVTQQLSVALDIFTPDETLHGQTAAQVSLTSGLSADPHLFGLTAKLTHPQRISRDFMTEISNHEVWASLEQIENKR